MKSKNSDLYSMMCSRKYVGCKRKRLRLRKTIMPARTSMTPQFSNLANTSLRALNSDWDQRLARLMKDPKDLPTAAVIRWLAKDGHTRFKHKVFPPPIMCVGLKDKAYATIVDSCFRKLDLMVCSSPFPFCLGLANYRRHSLVCPERITNCFVV